MKEVEVAILAAREVGQLMLDWRKDFPPGPARMEYKDAKDVVTEVDTRSEEIIVNHIRQHFPDHHILAEERGEEAGAADSPYTWVIDPLDGTANYAADLATSCVSIALAKEDEVIMGVVYNPFRDEMFVAEKGRGTLLNDRPIRVFPTEKLEKALVCFDLGYNEEKAVEQLRQAMFFRPRVRSMRILGSGVLGLVNVAVGRFDLFYHQALKPWDLAAALVILQEAGAVVTQNDGQPANYLKPSVIAASPLVYREFMEALDIYHKTK
ncbi:MAG: inositol monophosphatase [Chloroflexi bacterium]|nr:inositol monophosphatase [Chloroflexota bacterium]